METTEAKYFTCIVQYDTISLLSVSICLFLLIFVDHFTAIFFFLNLFVMIIHALYSILIV